MTSLAVQGTQAEWLEKARDAARRSLYFLCTKYLGYKDWDKVHDELEVMLNSPSKRKLILVPRGHLKTAIVTKAYTIQKLLKNPDSRILIANQVWDKAREMLYEIKDYLTTKSELPLLFGNFVSERWNQDELVIRQRKKALSAPSVGTTGVEAEMTSTHYDVIIGDDLQGLQNCQTPEQRQKVKRFYRSLLDLLEPGGELIIVGTRWHQDDLYQEILDNERDFYDVTVRKAVEDGKIIFPKKFSFKMDSESKSWVHDPTGMSFDYINYLKKSKGAEYFAQYENNPIDEEHQLFKKGMFKYWGKKPEGLYVGMAVDFAISEARQADYTAIVVLGMDKDWNLYVLDYMRGHWSPSDIVRNIFDMQSRWKPFVVGMEVNGFQRTLKTAVEEEMRKRRQYFGITEIRNGPEASKETRIKSLEPFYRSGSVYHAAWMQDKELEQELMAFPKGKNDDLIDAAAMTLPLMHKGSDAPVGPLKEWTWDWCVKMAHLNDHPNDGFFHYNGR